MSYNPFSDIPSAFQMQPINIAQLQPPMGQQVMLPQQNMQQQQYLPPVNPLTNPNQQQPQMDFSQVTTDEPSPHGLIGDVLNQYISSKQQNNNSLVQQILAQRFQPTQQDTMDAYNQNTAALYVPGTFKSTTPTEVATGRAALELAPYTAAAKLQDASVASGGGATGALVNRLMAGNPGMSFSDALYSVQTGFRQGLQRGPDGTVTNIPGVVPAKAGLAGAEAGARTAGENTAKAQSDLPSITATANQSLVDIDTLMSDPGLDAISGIRGMVPPIPGSQGAETLARLKQVGGQTFLAAYNQLRGGGAISDAEGNRAIAAKGRLDQAQSKDAIVSALKELRSVVQTGVQVAKIRASGNPGDTPSDLGMPAAPTGGGGVSDPLGIR